MPEVISNYTVPSTGVYYVWAYPYRVTYNVDVRFEISVNGVLKVNATGATKKAVVSFPVSGLCNTKVQVTDNTGGTVYQFSHNSANLVHYRASESYSTNFTLQFEKSD